MGGLVQVVMSTFNGARYLAAQFDSLLAQDYGEVDILVRDDGSTDGTLDLLRRYEQAYGRIRVVQGEHIGFVASFAEALGLVSPAAEFVALCDQDDVWHREKLARAVEALRRSPRGTPALYCSRLEVVDEQLAPLGLSPLPAKRLSFRNALVESQAVGCTIVLNRAARALLRGFPHEVVSHDWWLYLVVSAFGRVLYDERPAIRFRKHGDNVFGIAVERTDRWRTKLRQFRAGPPRPALTQARAFQRLHGDDLRPGERRVLERFLRAQRDVTSRLRYALSPDVYRQSAADQALLRVKLALGRV